MSGETTFDPLSCHDFLSVNTPWAARYSISQSFLTKGISPVVYSGGNLFHLRTNPFTYGAHELTSILDDFAVEVRLAKVEYAHIPESIDSRLLPQHRATLFLLAIAKLHGLGRAFECLDLLWKDCWLMEGRGKQHSVL